MEKHFHTGPETVLMAGISAIIVFNMVRFAAAFLGKQEGVIGKIGNGLGATVHFG